MIAGSHQSLSIGETIKTITREVWRRRVAMAIGFAVVGILVLLVGMMLPKKYVSETTILALEQNIVKELTAGVAVSTSLNDRAAMIRDVIFSRKVMLQILDDGGWMASKPTALQQARTMNEISNRTNISGGKDNLIRLSYSDSDPQRAYTVVTRMAELFMAEVREAKARESRDAFRFIDDQVQAYQQKLVDVENRMAAYRESNPDFTINAEQEASIRLTELRRQVEASKLELSQQRSIESALSAQLAATSTTTTGNKTVIRRATVDPRIADLQSQLNTALLNYTDQHPDVIRLREQLARAQAEDHGGTGALFGSTSQANPFYEQLRGRLSDVRSQIAGLKSRIDAGTVMAQSEFARSGRVGSGDQAGMELSSDYIVYRDLYQKLLGRRETARVSMNLDAEQSGLGFRIQEPALYPLESVGLRLLHIAIGGLLLALLLPIGVVAALSQFDGKLRTSAALERALGIPVMATVPALRTSADQGRERKRTVLAMALVVSTLLIYVIVFVLRQWSSM